jgi:hypothetical protein
MGISIVDSTVTIPRSKRRRITGDIIEHLNRDLFPEEHSTSQARLWEDNIGTLRDADGPISGIHAPVAVDLLRGTPPT